MKHNKSLLLESIRRLLRVQWKQIPPPPPPHVGFISAHLLNREVSYLPPPPPPLGTEQPGRASAKFLGQIHHPVLLCHGNEKELFISDVEFVFERREPPPPPGLGAQALAWGPPDADRARRGFLAGPGSSRPTSPCPRKKKRSLDSTSW